MHPEDIANRLQNLREHLESFTPGLTVDQALLLTDVCTALGFNDNYVRQIAGKAAWRLINTPLPIHVDSHDPSNSPPSRGEPEGGEEPKDDPDLAMAENLGELVIIAREIGADCISIDDDPTHLDVTLVFSWTGDNARITHHAREMLKDRRSHHAVR